MSADDSPHHQSQSRTSQRQHDVITTQIDALKDEMRTRFESMEQILNQRIRHGDANSQIVMEMLTNTIKDLQANQHEHDIWAKTQVEKMDLRIDTMEREHDTRFRVIEDKQLSWASSAKMIGAMIGGASALAGLAGTLVGMSL